MELADDDLDVHAGLAEKSENFDHPAAGDGAGAVGIAVDLHVDHLAVARFHGPAGVDEDVVVEPDVERHDEGLIGMLVKAADHGAMRAAKHTHHFADDQFPLAELLVLRLLLVDADDDQVAVHGALHPAAVDVDVGLIAAAAVDRAVAVGMDADASGGVGGELQE
jgi:hypothetical protein